MKSLSKDSSDAVFDIMDALRAPILTFSTSWADCIPQRLKEIIPMARLKSVLTKDAMASDAEAVAYIITRSFEAPMHGEWVNIYAHLGCKVCEEWWGENHWDKGVGERTISDYERKEFLNPLKHWIYEKRRKILKDEMKQMLKKSVTITEMESPITPILVECEQLSLF
jgi:hypothetical protein